MATPIVMPRLGDFMTEGVVSKFSKSIGDKVDQGEVIAEIETEKVNYDKVKDSFTYIKINYLINFCY